MYDFVFIGIFFSFSFNKFSYFGNVTSTYYMEMKYIYINIYMDRLSFMLESFLYSYLLLFLYFELFYFLFSFKCFVLKCCMHLSFYLISPFSYMCVYIVFIEF